MKFYYCKLRNSELYESLYDFVDEDFYEIEQYSYNVRVIHSKEDEYARMYVTSHGGHLLSIEDQKFLYNAGYRRELTKEEIRLWLQGRYDFIAFNNWLKEEVQKYPSPSIAIKAIHKEYNVRSRLIELNGEVYRKKDLRLLRVLNENTWEFEDTYVSNTIGLSRLDTISRGFVKRDSPLFYNGKHLYDIINHFAYCEDHGTIHHELEGCPVCRQMYKIHSYSEDALRFFEFKKEPKERYPIFMGVELEYDTPQGMAVPILKKFGHHMIAKRDGSISGFELVTAPATFAVHKKEFEFFPFEHQTVSKATGMHVHVGRKELTTMQIGKVCEFLYNEENLPFIELVAGRKLNSYCAQDRLQKGVVKGIRETEDGFEYAQEGSHGTALNISSKNTVEFRIFASPNSKESFLSKLEFVKAMIDWTSPGAVAIGIKQFKFVEKFKEFLNNNKAIYPNLFNTVYNVQGV